MEGARNLRLEHGFVGDEQVNVSRNTRCELAAIRRHLVRDNQLLNKKFLMITIDGEAKVVQAAHVTKSENAYTYIVRKDLLFRVFE